MNRHNLFIIIESYADGICGPLQPEDFPETWGDLEKMRHDIAMEHYSHGMPFIFVHLNSLIAYSMALKYKASISKDISNEQT